MTQARQLSWAAPPRCAPEPMGDSTGLDPSDRTAMDITLRNVPLSEELLQYIRRRARRVDSYMNPPWRVIVHRARSIASRARAVEVFVVGFCAGDPVVAHGEEDDAFLAVRNAFDRLEDTLQERDYDDHVV